MSVQAIDGIRRAGQAAFRGRIRLAYLAGVGIFLWAIALCYIPGQGFTYLIMFGENEHARYLPELKTIKHFEISKSYGYDGEYYAQIAMRGRLDDPELAAAIDSLPYRARRILFCWTAYALAFGDPARALHIYAGLNIVCWLLLAALLLRWFPARTWGDWVRWSCVLWSAGMCFSVRRALVDGPSLLLIAGGVALAEVRRPWCSAALLGIAGLGKETNVLGAVALAGPEDRSIRNWGRVALRCAVVGLPLAVWLLTLRHWIDGGVVTGERNFAAPLVAYVGKCREIVAQWRRSDTEDMALRNLFMMVTVSTQFLFFALRPQWRTIWWRIGATYALLMLVLGEAVWEGYPSAVSRVVLPMTLAFNILLPRTRRWWAVLVLGNLSVVFAPGLLQPAPQASYQVTGPHTLAEAPKDGAPVEVLFGEGWYATERSWREYWRWSSGPANVTLRNPQTFALSAEVTFELRANDRREATIRQGAKVLWQGTLQPTAPRKVVLSGWRMEAGDTAWSFETDRPAVYPVGKDQRQIAFSLRNLEIRLLAPATAGAGQK